MNLVLDIGNTRLKAGLFKKNVLINYFEFNNNYYEKIRSILECNPILYTIVSNVSNTEDKLIQLLRIKTQFIPFNSSLKIPFKNIYKSKTTLGQDRIALVSSSMKQFPDENVLIIDLGSCITYDFINSDNEYIGGAISPGLNMRYKSLNNYTSNLPFLEPKKINYLIGKSSEESIHSGVINGIVSELNGAIDRYQKEFKKIRIVLTGGDYKFLFSKIKNSIFANSNFLLLGLNFLIELNKKK